ncbi:MAG: hypothetical protein ACOY6K_21000 [Pseudomonadota bacterium]
MMISPEGRSMTTIATRSIIRAALLSATLAFAASPHLAIAQSGSAGGSIGNTDKTLSGSRKVVRESAPARPSRASRSEPRERRSTRRSSGGGDSFDGAWLVASVGRPCGAASEAVLISSGRIVGQYTSGRVTANGQATGSGSSGGVSWTSSGKFSGRRGSGTFRRSDGCVGTWTASKQ